MTEPSLPEESLFLQALEIGSPEEQAAFLERACGTNVELRRSVETLLRHHRQGRDFLESPPTEVVEAAQQLAAPECEPPSLDFLAPSAEPGSLGRLGQYEILEVVGRGGFGVVLKGRDSKLDRIVALKTLAQSLASSDTARKRFVREAKAAAAVKHENVVGIYHVSDEGAVPYLVMECVSGLSLEEKLQQAGMLELDAILRIGMQIASGLAAAHKQGLVHRDVKPANILLENGVERVKITDFGLARAANDAAITQAGEVAGTPQYMSPEQALGQPVDQRSDLFSLGSVLYAMCTGRSPFRAESTVAALRRVCDDAPRSIREINPEIPESLVTIITRLLAKNPAERFQTAAEVAELLSRHLAEVQHPSAVGQVSNLPIESKAGLKRAPRRRLWAVAATVLLCLVVGIGLAEATGTTQLTATVIRILTPSGTLIVEADDPAVKVTIEGDGGLVISGAGPQEVRLRPGSYRLRADKDGKPVRPDRELVTITRGDKQVVRVRLEGGPSTTPKSAPQPEPQAFIVLGGQGVPERKFDTLTEAVLKAGDGDAIEVRGNGPFVSEPVKIGDRALTIRAAGGFRPIIKLSPASVQAHARLLVTEAPLVLEGLEFQRIAQHWKGGEPWQPVVTTTKTLHVAHCRFQTRNTEYCIQTTAPVCELRNCEFVSSGSFTAALTTWKPQRLIIDNCLQTNGEAFVVGQEQSDLKETVVQLTRNTFRTRSQLFAFVLNHDPALSVDETKQRVKALRVDASGNIFDAGSFFLFDTFDTSLSKGDAESFVKRTLGWNGERNLYAVDRPFVKLIWRNKTIEPTSLVRTLADWMQFGPAAEADSTEGRVRYQGGDLLGKVESNPEQLTPDDFRLRADSAGYRAGKDGKDLGADVDLVGPGEAYERWKKTPEYQQWLKDTGQRTQRTELKPAPAGRLPLPGAASPPCVLIILASQGFFYPDYIPVWTALRRAGVQVLVAAPTAAAAQPQPGNPDHRSVTPDLVLANVNGADYDAIYFCGGNGVEEFIGSGPYAVDARRVTGEALAAKKYVTALGTGPGVLADAGVLNGVRATCYRWDLGVSGERLTSAGAIWVDEPTVVSA